MIDVADYQVRLANRAARQFHRGKTSTCHASSTQSIFGVLCRFQCDRPVLVNDASTAIHLYRITQEAVSNAIHHGHTKPIVISLSTCRGHVILAIANDGRKFPKRLPRKGGMGLQVMGYRAEGIGGILTVQQGPTGGTLVTCEFSVKPGKRKRTK